MYALDIDKLVVDYGKFKTDMSLKIRRGCVTGLVGRNGAGKSTLIKAIMRQIDAVSGKILYDGKPFRGNETEIFGRVACVFDAPHFNIYSKPSKIFKMFKSVYRQFDEELYRRLMNKFSLPDNLRFIRFSYGMQRKYCLILALCQKPDLLILDEPTSGVDPLDRSAVVELIQEFMMDEKHTVIFSTHMTEDLDKIADYIVVLENGRVILDEDKVSITENYRLVQTSELTDELRAEAIGVQKSMFGYTFLTKNRQLGGKNLQIKTPTVEELFVHLLREGSPNGLNPLNGEVGGSVYGGHDIVDNGEDIFKL